MLQTPAHPSFQLHLRRCSWRMLASKEVQKNSVTWYLVESADRTSFRRVFADFEEARTAYMAVLVLWRKAKIYRELSEDEVRSL